MLVKEAMSTKIETIAPKTTVRECARKMDQMDIGLLAVWEDGKLIGVLTDRDICCRAVAGGRDPATATAREIMTRDSASCFEDQDCTEAARIMEQKHVRRLTVMNHKNAMVGLLSVDDLARYSHDLAGEVLESASPWPH
jgi:CBS domain-containing protein